VKRIYQWLTGQASFFGLGAVGHGIGRTVRTEVTVRREGITLLVGGAATVGIDTCPLCGSKLASDQASTHTKPASLNQRMGQHLSIGTKVAGNKEDST